jgi:hypothetical protein
MVRLLSQKRARRGQSLTAKYDERFVLKPALGYPRKELRQVARTTTGVSIFTRKRALSIKMLEALTIFLQKNQAKIASAQKCRSAKVVYAIRSFL